VFASGPVFNHFTSASRPDFAFAADMIVENLVLLEAVAQSRILRFRRVVAKKTTEDAFFGVFRYLIQRFVGDGQILGAVHDFIDIGGQRHVQAEVFAEIRLAAEPS
jgi:hypothetical protein